MAIRAGDLFETGNGVLRPATDDRHQWVDVARIQFNPEASGSISVPGSAVVRIWPGRSRPRGAGSYEKLNSGPLFMQGSNCDNIDNNRGVVRVSN